MCEKGRGGTLPYALLFDDAAVLPQVTTTARLVVAYLALTCTCLSYVLQNTAHPDGGMLVPAAAGAADSRGPHRRGHHRGLRGVGELAERTAAKINDEGLLLTEEAFFVIRKVPTSNLEKSARM